MVVQEAKQINLLFAGFDTKTGEHAGPQLYFMDHLACMAKVPYAAQGYGGFFTLSILDRHYKPDLSLDEAKDLLKQCIAEVLQTPILFFFFDCPLFSLMRLGQVQHRFIANMPSFITRVVDADGVRVVEL